VSEFGYIEKYFKPLTMGHAGALGLKDDAAILNIPKGFELVVSSDMLGAGTHFLKNEKPVFIAHKALRTNLSDLAAMGAVPYAYQLSIGFPTKPSEAWMKEFTSALLKDQKEFKIFCSGGDTTVTKGTLTISITIFGLIPKNKSVKRNGAKVGDALVITGAVGDALLGLKILQKKSKAKSLAAIAAYRKPTPRTAIADIVRVRANAAIDISDGLIADVGHICEASKCGVRIDLENIKFSKVVQQYLKPAQALTGGDDYELALAVSPKNLPAFFKKLRARGLQPQVIGKFTKGKPTVQVFDKKRKIPIEKAGWTHF
jgi:thiamine-monophosphate kinase